MSEVRFLSGAPQRCSAFTRRLMRFFADPRTSCPPNHGGEARRLGKDPLIAGFEGKARHSCASRTVVVIRRELGERRTSGRVPDIVEDERSVLVRAVTPAMAPATVIGTYFQPRTGSQLLVGPRRSSMSRGSPLLELRSPRHQGADPRGSRRRGDLSAELRPGTPLLDHAPARVGLDATTICPCRH